MNIITLTKGKHEDVINRTLKVLKAGGLVVFPSDTVYGLLADATNPKAVDKLLYFKERPSGKAISVFVADKEMAGEYVILNQNANNIINNLLPGPFTLICNSRHKTDSRLEAENGTLGIRIPDYSPVTELLKQFGKPITATSANVSGNPPVHSISALVKNLSQKKKNALNLVIDAGILPKNKPSTVVDTTTGQLRTLRIGDLLPKTSSSLISKSERETKELARFLATKFIKKNLSRPLVFLLEGDLGAGKTIFAKGLGKALGVKEEIASPTYTISYEYKIDKLRKLPPNKPSGNKLPIPSDIQGDDLSITKENIRQNKFIHYDLFRLEGQEDLKEIDFLGSFSCGNIYAVEWPERLPAEIISALKNLAEIVYLRIKTLSENEREISWGKT